PTVMTLLHPSLPLSSLTPASPPNIYTLSLHDALPISLDNERAFDQLGFSPTIFDRPTSFDTKTSIMGVDLDLPVIVSPVGAQFIDRKSTRLNSSHVKISYAVFCLKKKKNK